VEARAAEGVRLRWFQALATLEVAATLDRLIEATHGASSAQFAQQPKRVGSEHPRF
jgi:hypothetical protein